MNISKRLSFAAAVLMIAAAALTGCSDQADSQQPTPMQKLTHTISATVAESVIQAVKADADTTAAETDTLAPMEAKPNAEFAMVNKATGNPVEDMIVIGTSVFALTDEGVVVFDFVSRSQRLIASEHRLSAIASHAGKLYVGGDGLYVVEDSTLEAVDIDIATDITSLEGFSFRLLVGTENGLYSRSIFGDEVLLEGLPISAIVSTGDDVWVGTEGSGLYQFDGVDFKQRYLSRDPSILDHVTALDYQYSHLYVGTLDGLFVFDGGRWEEYNTADGLPSPTITSIDASDWVVIVGTEYGVTSLFNRNILPLGKLDAVNAASVARYGKKILVGTADGELLVKAGPVVRPLIRNADTSTVNVFSVLK